MTVRTSSAAALVGLTVVVAPLRAEPLAPGSIGVSAGGVAGTGPDANALGIGYVLGAHAAWQPTLTEKHVGTSLKLAVLFGTLYTGEAARINDPMKTLQLDLMVGIRVRPGDNPSRYLTLRAGGALLRADQQIPPDMHRAYAGGIASIGLEQHLFGFLFNLDVRYSMIGMRPGMLGLVFGASKMGP